MIDYLEAIRKESQRLVDLVDSTPWHVSVPSCPGWTVADLTWHVAEVQHSWASVVEDLLTDDADIPELMRPADDELVELLRNKSRALATAIESRQPSDVCWSWHDAGRNVGWVSRRQAHEALIHRVDAELAAGTTDIDIEIDEQLAADGVDEIMTLFLDASDIPGWSVFVERDGVTELALPHHDTSWLAELGRFQGTSPNSGAAYDEEAIRLITGRIATTTVSGSAGSLDRWLWGRGSIDRLTIEGDRDEAAWIRAAARHATQ